MGRFKMATAPTRVMAREITMARTRRCTKKPALDIFLLLLRLYFLHHLTISDLADSFGHNSFTDLKP